MTRFYNCRFSLIHTKLLNNLYAPSHHYPQTQSNRYHYFSMQTLFPHFGLPIVPHFLYVLQKRGCLFEHIRRKFADSYQANRRPPKLNQNLEMSDLIYCPRNGIDTLRLYIRVQLRLFLALLTSLKYFKQITI